MTDELDLAGLKAASKRLPETWLEYGPGVTFAQASDIATLVTTTPALIAEIERLRAALHDAEAIGDFSEELRDRLALKEAAACVPQIMVERDELAKQVLQFRDAIEAYSRLEISLGKLAGMVGADVHNSAVSAGEAM
jgi:hypothetical protein